MKVNNIIQVNGLGPIDAQQYMVNRDLGTYNEQPMTKEDKKVFALVMGGTLAILLASIAMHFFLR